MSRDGSRVQALPNGKTLSVIVKALHVVLYDLTPGTEYSFKVRTINDAKSSPFSLMVLNKTLEAGQFTKRIKFFY